MELDVLKQSWQNLDKKIEQANRLNQKLVETIISSRVMTTLEKIKRTYSGFYFVLIVEAVVLTGILGGNPFDFNYKLQYLPFVLLLVGVIIAFFNLLHISKSISRLLINLPIDQYIQGVVSVYDRNKKFERWFAIVLLSVGLIVPLSFLPQKIERMGVGGAIADIAIMMSVSLVIYIVAFKFGAFRNRHKENLQRDLADWNELKNLVNGMSQDQPA